MSYCFPEPNGVIVINFGLLSTFSLVRMGTLIGFEWLSGSFS